MPMDFKLNLNLSPREKRLATPFAQVMKKKAYTHLIYCYGDNGDSPSFLFSSLPSCKGPKPP